MTLEAGVISITLEYAKGLKDKDIFGRQDPYCILRVGGQTRRSKTAKDGGRDPVWGETVEFIIMNENHIDVEIKDEDVGRDDVIGTACVSLARARQTGHDRMQVAVMRKDGRKQHGHIFVMLRWKSNSSMAQQYCTAMSYTAAAPYAVPPAALPPAACAGYPPPASAFAIGVPAGTPVPAPPLTPQPAPSYYPPVPYPWPQANPYSPAAALAPYQVANVNPSCRYS